MENNNEEWADKVIGWVFKKAFRYFFTVLATIVEVVIVLIVFDNYHYSDSLIVLSAIGIVYSCLRSLMYGLSMRIDNLAVAFGRTLDEIRANITDMDDEDKVRMNEEMVSASEKIRISNIKYIIRSVGVFIVFVISLVNLLN